MEQKIKHIKGLNKIAQLTSDEFQLIKKGTDFLAENFYNSNFNWPDNAEYNLLYIKDQLVGFVIVETWPDASFAFLSKLYVLEEHRRKGYAEILVNYVKTFYKDFVTIEAGVVLENVASIKLFEKLATKKAMMFQL